ncbi:pilus assembly protein TadE [Vibrio sp. HA2012]|uniref:TadE/TadG family type IV pilus assembly protein n=1 Tax=Vibrio sp. HA2012 TaxID=1971595 RepID=UPI000C2C52E2|nr:TadE family protein [Vibrio sp. HA2012]PJC86091.1 pilus assembly protein TadE [Vibrio sp. HA2012]
MARKTRTCQKGVVAIEFALGFFVFWLMMATWVEMSYMSYISSVGDYAIAKASREAKKDTENYISTFKSIIESNDSLLSDLVDPESFKVGVRYLDTLSELERITDVCSTDSDGEFSCGSESETNKAIAIYHIEYDYNSMFSYFLDDTTVFSREVIVVQEYERNQFDFNG